MDANFEFAPLRRVTRWLTPDRMSAYVGTIVLTLEFVYLMAGAFVAWQRFHEPLGFDFGTFWAAARLGIGGTPVLAWSETALGHTLHAVAPHAFAPGPWFYPPAFLIAVMPLGLLPFQLALILFAVGTMALFIVLLRRALPLTGSTIWILAFPGLWLNYAQGQNAALTASLALASFMLLQRDRSIWAGICVGLLSVKPQLAILFPVALACAGMWRAFFMAAATAMVLSLGSVLILGAAVVPAFLHGLGLAAHYIVTGRLPWYQMASVFASLRLDGFSAHAAYAVQIGVAVAAVVVVGWVWRRTVELDIRVAALVAGTFLISPYIYNYDCAWLAIPIVMLTRHALRERWLRGDRAVMVLAWLYPAFADDVVAGWGPLLFALLLAVAVRRAWLFPGSAEGPNPATSVA